MIGLSWGSLLAIGLLMIFKLWPSNQQSTKPVKSGFDLSGRDLLYSLGVACVVWILQVPALSLISFVAVAVGLRQRRKMLAQRVFTERSQAWPDAIDFLISSIRAGMTISSSLIELQRSGPEVLRPVLLPVHQAIVAGAPVTRALQLLRIHAQDPVADRIALILEISQEVGGVSLGAVLRSLSSYVRAEARTRAELISRQAWTINAAKLAVVAPWLIVLLLSVRAHDAYATATGSVLLLVGSLATSLGHAWMRRAALLPLPTRLA